MSCKTCGQPLGPNGWVSQETFLVNDRITANPKLAKYWREMAAEFLTEEIAQGADGAAGDDAADRLAELLEHSFTETLPALELPELFESLTAAALKRVDWDQIALAFVEGVQD